MKRQLLDIGNALRIFNKEMMRIISRPISEQIPLNQKRYYLLKYKGEDKYLFFKFSREPYYLAKFGMSDSINIDTVKKLVGMHNKGDLDYLYFMTKEGYIYRIHIKDFLDRSYKYTEERKERKTKRIVAYKELERVNHNINIEDIKKVLI